MSDDIRDYTLNTFLTDDADDEEDGCKHGGKDNGYIPILVFSEQFVWSQYLKIHSKHLGMRSTVGFELVLIFLAYHMETKWFNTSFQSISLFFFFVRRLIWWIWMRTP